MTAAVDARALLVCEAILRKVPLADVRAGDDADDAFLKADAATMIANGRIGTGAGCVGDVRARYATQK